MQQIKLTLPDDVASWLVNDLGAGPGTMATVAGDVIQAVHSSFKHNSREVRFRNVKLTVLVTRSPQ